MPSEKKIMLKRRHLRLRKRVSGTAERPRLCVHKSLRHIYAQLIDDESGTSLIQISSNCKAFKGENGRKNFRNVATARAIGKQIAERALAAGIQSAVFDRGGFLYHGCIKALAEAAREAGLKI